MARNSLKNIAKLVDRAKVKLPPEQEFLQDLKRSIELSEIKNRRAPSNYYKPSSMNCIRNMYYTRTGKKEDDLGSSYISWGICNSGTDTHERVQKAVQQMCENGINCEYVDVAEFVKQRNLKHLEVVSKEGMETKLLHKVLNISFLCDGIIRYQNHYYILELKTESSGKWFNRDNVNPSHYHQAIAYSLSLELDEVIFVYINRDIFDMKAFMYNVTDDMKDELVSIIEECDSYVSKLITPPKPNNVAKKTCEYCPYKLSCRKE